MLYLLVFTLVLGLNLTGFGWCYSRQSDKLTDLIYSLSFALVAIVLWNIGESTFTQKVLWGMLIIWAMRLGTYLFVRINAIGKDERFDKMRVKWWAIGGFWLLQTISIYILLLPFIYFHENSSDSWNLWRSTGVFCWLFGLVLETVADFQKYRAKRGTQKAGFVSTGVWRYLRHPNYTGEIMCWVGMFVFTVPDLSGLGWVGIVSPLWITTLLLFISGIPLLDKQHDAKYGQLKEYQEYKNNTWRLLPFVY